MYHTVLFATIANNSFNMLYLVAVLLLASSVAQALPCCGVTLVGPGAHGAVVQGPSAQAGLLGPDGSVISAAAIGGAVAAAPRHGGIVSGVVAPGGIALTGHGLGLGHGIW